ncbi:NAD-dependent SIR2 family protein deacetylase [Evansella vedderi]|uniref:protein acetyllysine N-acetyltransferase n=1 Tax=Evansella vedderi TaxID=38282 RepID=A0ABU0A2Y0_9BACI|nr:NAD-dependent deacylase [Evansella vedderi]MDQ0257842.1 NAD-dependent SIR2 family protein deacetylase [Evansella vedderi]
MNKAMGNDWQTIISLGAEGGSITLLGKEQHPGQWVFKKAVNEMNFDDLEDETFQPTESTEEVRTLKSPLSNLGNEATSWEKAIKLLDHYPWPMLNPREIHPAFRKRVWIALQKEVKERYGDRIDSYRLNKWSKLCLPEYAPKIVTLSTWLKNSTHTTVLTGAGMSTESNIPDFRSKEGWWNNIDPRTVATTDALRNNYDLFHEFYSMRINGLRECTPHKGHEILADWEHKGHIQAIATQNVDGFHYAAGNENVYELHGSIHKFRCENCAKSAEEEDFLSKSNCKYCGGKLRPGVVLFGEMLPEGSWSESLSHFRKSDLVIVIGTSLEVYPASQLPQMTNGKTVYINVEVNAHNHNFDLIIEGKAGEVMKLVDELV